MRWRRWPPGPHLRTAGSAAADRGLTHPGELMAGDADFLDSLRQAQITDVPTRVNAAIYLLLALVATALAWAAWARVDVVTRADGRVVPTAREQVIASLEGGLLRALDVQEGSVVEAGQALAQLDPTRFAAQQGEGQARSVALQGTLARLDAEAGDQPLRFPRAVQADAAVVAAETEAYRTRRRLLDEAVAVIGRSLALLDGELATAHQMTDRGLMSEVEVLRLQRQRNDLLMQLQERRNRFRQDASTERLRVRSELAQLGEQQVARADALERTVLRSPVRGIVKNIRVGTLGGVVAAGAPILEIVPLTDQVLIEARLKAADIGFIHVGQGAEIKLSAYDYFTYGGLKGTVDYISPDAFGDERGGADAAGSGPGPGYYRVRIRTDARQLGTTGRPLAVLPGMAASVEIRTGDRTVLDFLVKPLFKGSEAFRER